MVPALKRDVYDQVAYTPPARRLETERRETVYSHSAPAAGAAVASSRRLRPVSPYVALPLVGLLLLAVGMGLVAQRVQVMALNYALLDAKGELAKLQQERTRLEAELARSRSLERVEFLARTRLGMVDPDPAAVVVVAGSSAVTGAQQSGEAEAESASWLTALGHWLRGRWQDTAAAGGRWREP